jgi:hypothetical protein
VNNKRVRARKVLMFHLLVDKRSKQELPSISLIAFQRRRIPFKSLNDYNPPLGISTSRTVLARILRSSQRDQFCT